MAKFLNVSTPAAGDEMSGNFSHGTLGDETYAILAMDYSPQAQKKFLIYYYYD